MQHMQQQEAVSKLKLLLNPRQIYYGWWVVATVMLGLIFGYSTFVGVVFGLFVKPLATEFGWSRTEISVAVTISATLIVVLSPLLGGLVDRFGVRRILLPGFLAFGLSVCGLALLTGPLWQLYAMYVILPILGLTTLPTTYSRVILNWFDEKRGLALGIGLCGVGLAAVIVPPAVQWVISGYGWRAAYLAIAAFIILVGWPIVYFFLKESPDNGAITANANQANTAEKGSQSEKGSEGAKVSANEQRGKTDIAAPRNMAGLSFAVCLKGKAFWLMVFAFLLLGVCSIGVATHLMAMLTDRGFGAQQAAFMYAIMGAFTMIGRISCGYFVDHYFAPLVAAVFLCFPAIGMMLLAVSNDYVIVLTAMCLVGLGFGAEFDLMSYLVSRYMGLRIYGKVYGIIYALFALGAAVGPIIMGVVFDLFGNYLPGLWAFSGCILAAVVLLLALGAYPVFDDDGR